MKNLAYSSPVAGHLKDYVGLRRNLGYELRTQVYILRQFDRVLKHRMKRCGPVTRTMVEDYLRSMNGLKPLTRRVRISVIRQFLLYLRQAEPRTFIPDLSMGPARSSPRPPYIYTAQEIASLLREALRFPRRYPTRRWLLYHTLFGFLYATGMRISEVLALRLEDIDWGRAVILIRKTKFHKTRLVPFMPSTGRAIRRYLAARAERGYATTPEVPLFVAEKGGRLPASTVTHAFKKIAREAGLRYPGMPHPPRIHDLRHSASVRRLELWYREDKDVQVLLPALMTYLGHSSLAGTEIYLTATAELLSEASGRFERHFDLDAQLHGESQ